MNVPFGRYAVKRYMRNSTRSTTERMQTSHVPQGLPAPVAKKRTTVKDLEARLDCLDETVEGLVKLVKELLNQ